MLEMLARVEAVLRRTPVSASASTFRRWIKCLSILTAGRYTGTGAAGTDPKEYELLEVLVKNREYCPGQERLLELVWGYDFEGRQDS